MSGIYVNVGVGLRPNEVRKAIVKSVSYEEPEWSTCGLRRIHMETQDGLNAEWDYSNFCRVHADEFWSTRENILTGKITEGTEVIIEYNHNGIMCFYLEEEP